MKILQVCPAFYPAISIGGPIFSLLGITRLIARDHTVVTLTTQLGLDETQCTDVIYNTLLPFSGGGEIIYKRYFGYSNFTFSPNTAQWLFGNVKCFDLVILNGVWNFPLIAAAWICKWKKVPYVLFPHGTLYRETVELRSGIFKHLLLKLCVNKMLENASRIVFTTDDEAHKVVEYLGLKLRPFIAPNIVESADFSDLPERGLFRKKYGIAETTRVLIHYGRITRKKGIEFAIKSVVALRAKGYDVVLIVAGGDSEGYRAVLDKQLDEINGHQAVIFTGMLSRQDGKSALVDADIFVLPSYSENFGMAVVEAMLCGLPVVISNNVGLADDIARAEVGLIVQLTDDARNVTGALERLLRDEPYRRSLAERGRQFAIATYDTPAVESRIAQLLTDATTCVPPTK